VRKFFGRAFLSAALLGCAGLSYADDANSPTGAENGDVTYESSKNDSCTYHCCQCDCECLGSCLDNTTVFAGFDVYKSVGDRITNINGGTGGLTNSFGAVTGFNTGFGLGESDIRGQFGASYGVYDFRGRLALVPQATDVEEQQFSTTGVYKRGDILHGDAWSYGAVVDQLHFNNWGVNANEIDLGQVRGIVGYALNGCTEVGGWGTAHVWDDNAAVTVAGAPGVRREVRAANQLNAYVANNYAFGGQTMFYVGGFDGADIQAWQFGGAGEAPLSNYLSLYGNFNYAVPSAGAGPNGSGEEQFNIQLGIAYFIGGKAQSRSVTGQRGLPLLDVANNSTFLITD
jgi:hypothetical protein